MGSNATANSIGAYPHSSKHILPHPSTPSPNDDDLGRKMEEDDVGDREEGRKESCGLVVLFRIEGGKGSCGRTKGGRPTNHEKRGEENFQQK